MRRLVDVSSLRTRHDITLQTFHRVAWQGGAVTIAPTAIETIADSRRAFLALIGADTAVTIYGVTTAMGDLAHYRLDHAQQSRHARIKPFAAATAFGDNLPDRVVRGMVLARLANFLGGHAATTPRIALAVAAMLDGQPMPRIAGSGQGGAGEILSLYPLFAELSRGFDLEVKERGSLINGSPCAAALVADAALAAHRRIDCAVGAFALSIEAFHAPREHYDPALGALWGDEYEAMALQRIGDTLTGGDDGRRAYQAPVSYRITPKLLGQAQRALATAERAATISLSSVSDNPVFLAPDGVHPRGRCISTGGYHNGLAAPALDDLAAVWADLCQLCLRQVIKLLDGRASHLPNMLLVGREDGESDGHGHLGYIPMAMVGYVEQARAAAQTSFIPSSDIGGAGQDDVAAPAFIAYAREAMAGRCLDASLAMLAVIASEALRVTNRAPPPKLCALVDLIRAHVPPVVEDRVLGPDLESLATSFTETIFDLGAPLHFAASSRTQRDLVVPENSST